MFVVCGSQTILCVCVCVCTYISTHTVILTHVVLINTSILMWTDFQYFRNMINIRICLRCYCVELMKHMLLSQIIILLVFLIIFKVVECNCSNLVGKCTTSISEKLRQFLQLEYNERLSNHISQCFIPNRTQRTKQMFQLRNLTISCKKWISYQMWSLLQVLRQSGRGYGYYLRFFSKQFEDIWTLRFWVSGCWSLVPLLSDIGLKSLWSLKTYCFV